MMGVGVGFDTKGSSESFKINKPKEGMVNDYVIADTREGWVESLRVLLKSYFYEN